MSRTDKVLKFICHALGLLFTLVTAFALVGCLFGFVLMGHLDNAAEIYEQVRALALVAFICFVASCAIHCTAELIN